MKSEGLGGILLTGGSSSRMGRDKAALRFDGTSLGERSANLLRAFSDLAVEVGEGISGLVAVREEPRSEGPLAAIIAGHRELIRMGLDPIASCLVLACDLPLLDAWVLERIANWPGARSVLPVIANHAQPLCARWAAHDLEQARVVFAQHERSLRSLPDRKLAVLVDETIWGSHSIAFSDVDCPDDLCRLNLVHDELRPH